jgi:hypothetical protein
LIDVLRNQRCSVAQRRILSYYQSDAQEKHHGVLRIVRGLQHTSGSRDGQMDDKIIVTNGAALKAKYGSTGLTKIGQAVDALIKADAKRGIKSRLVFLDRAATMSSFNESAVTDPADPKQNKNAIDAIFRKANPEYLMILGAIDVVPHQDIKNPAFDPPDDPDPNADGDLP